MYMNALTMIENRLNKIEQLMVEKKLGKHGDDSLPFKIWKYLMDNGPKTVKEIQANMPESQAKGVPSSVSWSVNHDDLLVKVDNHRYAANPNYKWDDVGVIGAPTLADVVDAKSIDDVMSLSDETLIADLTLDQIADLLCDEFNSSAAGKLAQLVLDRKTKSKLFLTIEFDDIDETMKMNARVEPDGRLHIVVPFELLDEDEDVVKTLSWKGNSSIDNYCNDVKRVRRVMMTIGVAVKNAITNL